MNRILKNYAKFFLRLIFNFFQKIGFDVLPRHFYSQVPNIRYLKKNEYWKYPSDMTNILGNDIIKIKKNFENLFLVKDNTNFEAIHTEAVSKTTYDGGYGDMDSCVLYKFIIKEKPKKIIQIGCGVSTFVINKAINDKNIDCIVTCIEPHPDNALKILARSGKIKLISKKAQNILNIKDYWSKNGKNFLFVDSTHAVCPGSEVNKIIIEWLASMPRNSLIHFHDIYFPYEYQRNILKTELFFSSETSMLMAFLKFNQNFEINICLSMLHYKYPEIIKKHISHYEPRGNLFGLDVSTGKHFPCSIYLKKIK